MKRINVILTVLVFICFIFNIISLINIRNKKVIEVNKIERTLNNQISYKYEDDIYDAIISIPVINLKKGIYKKNDKRNNIKENVMIHKSSIYPDNNNSNVILMAHSGNRYNSYFKDLNKLNSDTLIEFYYNHIKYIYKIDNIYKQNKSGKISIYRDYEKTTLTLVTCTNNDSKTQTVYIAYLVETQDI